MRNASAVILAAAMIHLLAGVMLVAVMTTFNPRVMDTLRP